MTGIDRIKNRFQQTKSIKIMTHCIGGYPDMASCESLIVVMAEKGVDFIEIQLPFSDPIADGPVMVHANHEALRKGVTTESVLRMLESVRKRIDIPLLIMSYINPVYIYGVEKFLKRITDIGLDGVIIPDSPLEETELQLPEQCNAYKLAFVPLIAPTTSSIRMAEIVSTTLSPFVYAVLRMGVTGVKTALNNETIQYLNTIKVTTQRYIAAGFGIAEKSQIETLTGHADCAIIGSKVLRIIQESVEKGKDPVAAAGNLLDKLCK